jgi:hypothetical protein
LNDQSGSVIYVAQAQFERQMLDGARKQEDIERDGMTLAPKEAVSWQKLPKE